MNLQLRLVLKLVTIFGLAGGAICAHSQVGNSELGNTTSTKTWIGKSGNLWHHRLDAEDRILSIRRETSKGRELWLRYEGHSRRPVAVRLTGSAWHKIAPTLVSQNSSGTVSGIDVRTAAFAKPEFAKFPFAWAGLSQHGLTQALNTPSGVTKFTLKSVLDPSESDLYVEDMAIVEDMLLFEGDADYTYFSNYPTARTPEEIAKCIDGCDRWDWAFTVCAIVAENPPVAAGCVILMTYGKQECKRKCSY